MSSAPEVLVFVMAGCPACEQLKPLAERMAAHYGPCVQTKIVDVENDGGLSDAMGVEETPTVIGVNGAKQPIVRMVGHDGTPLRLERVYQTMIAQVSFCAIGPFHDV